jgi:hypothetical protein
VKLLKHVYKQIYTVHRKLQSKTSNVWLCLTVTFYQLQNSDNKIACTCLRLQTNRSKNEQTKQHSNTAAPDLLTVEVVVAWKNVNESHKINIAKLKFVTYIKCVSMSNFKDM